MTINEVGNTYVGNSDRFVVTLAVGYSKDDGPTTPHEALNAALDLITEPGCGDTQWYVYDRETKIMHMIEQSEVDQELRK